MFVGLLQRIAFCLVNLVHGVPLSCPTAPLPLLKLFPPTHLIVEFVYFHSAIFVSATKNSLLPCEFGFPHVEKILGVSVSAVFDLSFSFGYTAKPVDA